MNPYCNGGCGKTDNLRQHPSCDSKICNPCLLRSNFWQLYRSLIQFRLSRGDLWKDGICTACRKTDATAIEPLLLTLDPFTDNVWCLRCFVIQHGLAIEYASGCDQDPLVDKKDGN